MSITEHFFHPLVNALGWTILHSLWQFALLALMWRLVMHIVAKTHAVVRHNLTLFALLAMPLAFIITFIRQYSVYQNAGKIVSIGFENNEFLMASGSTEFYLLDKSYPAFMSQFEAYTSVIFWLYAVGLIIFSIITFITYSKWFTLRRKYTDQLSDEWLLRVGQLIKKAGLAKRVSVYLTSRLSIPVVVGFIKPVVLLPVAMLSSLTTEQVEVIILHELYHIRRKDHYINALQCLLEILFFYHPASWWISRQLRHEREKIVDEWVVQQCRQPLLYASALLNLEENRTSAVPQPAVAATQSKSLLFTRIKNFMTMKTRSFNVGQKLAAVMALVAAFISMAWVSPATTINLFDMHSDGSTVQAMMDHYDIASYSQEEIAPDAPPVIDRESEDTKQEPNTIYLHDGSQIQWEGLSERDRQKIARAMEEMRLAMHEINTEVFDYLASEEFRSEMQEAMQDAQKASVEAAKAGEEIRKAMEELREYMDSEEFREKTQKAGEEVQKAMEELRVQLESEEFKAEMRKAQEEVAKAMKDIEDVDWDAVRKDVREAMQELNKGLKEMEVELQEISPLIREMMFEFGQGMQELGPALQEILKGVEQGLQELGPVLHEMFKELPLDEEEK